MLMVHHTHYQRKFGNFLSCNRTFVSISYAHMFYYYSAETNKLTHFYTLILRRDGTYELRMDNNRLVVVSLIVFV
jgi:hypothetical protein